MLNRFVIIFSLLFIGLAGAFVPARAGSLGEDILQKTQNVSRDTFKTDIDPQATIFGGFNRTVNFILGLLMVVAVGLVVYSGFLWLTAGGNDQQITKAKGILKSVVIGILVISVAYSLVAFVFRQIESRQAQQSQEDN